MPKHDRGPWSAWPRGECCAWPRPAFDRLAIEAYVRLIHERAVGIEGIIPLVTFKEGEKPQGINFPVGAAGATIGKILSFCQHHPDVNLYLPWAVMRPGLPYNMREWSEIDVVAALAACGNQRGIVEMLPSLSVESQDDELLPIFVFPKPLTVEEAKPVLAALGAAEPHSPWCIPGTLNRQFGGSPYLVKVVDEYVEHCFADPGDILWHGVEYDSLGLGSHDVAVEDAPHVGGNGAEPPQDEPHQHADGNGAEPPPSRDEGEEPEPAITPTALKPKRLWVGWREEVRDGNKTKVPYNPKTNGRASSTSATTWGTFDQAHDWGSTKGNNGSGLLFGEGLMLAAVPSTALHIGGIDLDTCRDPATGAIEPWAQEVINRFATYTEVSPSKTGVKAFILYTVADIPAIAVLFNKDKLPDAKERFGRGFARSSDGGHPPAIEVYRAGRYFAFTGSKLPSSPNEMRVVSVADLQWVLEVAGPAFAGPEAEPKGEKKAKEKREKAKARDESRSAKAFRAGADLKREGKTYDEMRDALLSHSVLGIAEWAHTKGMANGEREMHRIFDNAEELDKKEAAPGIVVKVKGISKKITEIKSLNKRYAILETRGEPSIYIYREDFLPITDKDLQRRLDNEVVFTGRDPDGKPIYQPAAHVWKKNAYRHVYRHVMFTGKDVPEDTFNLFRGLGVVPAPGKCELIKQHILEILCSNDKIAYEAMLSLMAWQIQNIGKPSRIIVCLHNPKQQAGKGTIFEHVILKIYGPSGFPPSSTEQVLGRFNDALRGRAYLFMDEVVFHGDLRTANRLKALATASTMGLETKGIPTVQCPVGVNLWLLSNADVPVHVEDGDARYWMLRVSEHRIGDTEYFTRLFYEIEHGGVEAFADFLLKRDVSNFVPSRDVPKDNAEREAAIRDCLNPYDARCWLKDCATTEQIIGVKRLRDDVTYATWTTGEEYSFGHLWQAYTAWQATVKTRVSPQPTKNGNFGEVLGKAGLVVKKTNTNNRRVLPSAADCLEALADPLNWRR